MSNPKDPEYFVSTKTTSDTEMQEERRHTDLRDYFAGQALAGVSVNTDFGTQASTIANFAYDIADEMLKARGEEK